MELASLKGARNSRRGKGGIKLIQKERFNIKSGNFAFPATVRIIKQPGQPNPRMKYVISRNAALVWHVRLRQIFQAAALLWTIVHVGNNSIGLCFFMS